MNRTRSTTVWASVPSQTDAAMNSTSAASAPMPGDGILPEDVAADCARTSRVSGMVPLRLARQQLLLRLLFSQVFIRDDEIRKHERQHGASCPWHDQATEHPVRKTEHVGQRRRIATVAKAVAHADRIGARQ